MGSVAVVPDTPTVWDAILDTVGSNQVLPHFLTATNRAPIFLSIPFIAPIANSGQGSTATLATKASEPNGDTIAFAKVSGPAWLSVASNGGLTGTPLSPDAGTNVFTVRVADPGGLFNTATVNVVILPAPPIVISSVLQGDNLLLNWTGGIAPYQVRLSTNLLSPVWQDLEAPVSVNSSSASSANGSAFYRIYGR
jgi:hypothetical protein